MNLTVCRRSYSPTRVPCMTPRPSSRALSATLLRSSMTAHAGQRWTMLAPCKQSGHSWRCSIHDSRAADPVSAFLESLAFGINRPSKRIGTGIYSVNAAGPLLIFIDFAECISQVVVEKSIVGLRTTDRAATTLVESAGGWWRDGSRSVGSFRKQISCHCPAFSEREYIFRDRYLRIASYPHPCIYRAP